MAFPEFEPGKKRILYFSRGRGRGHAIQDIGIGRSLEAMRPDVEVRFVSYGTGAETFRAFDISLIDLGLPDFGGVVDTSVLAGKLIGWLQPELVVSHEEFPAIPAAKIFDKRTLVLTDWFMEAEGYAMNSLKYADQILFLGQAGVFPEPPGIHERVRYLGSVLRPFRYGRGDRRQARQELEIPEDAVVVSVFPGSWLEVDTPLLDAVLEAFQALEADTRRLIWLAGADYACVQQAMAGRPDVLVLEKYWDTDRLMVASDVAVTKTNRKTVFELQHLGVPVIAVSYGLNAGDDCAVAALHSVVRVSGRQLTGKELHRAIAELLLHPRTGDSLQFCSTQDCAEWISRAV